MDDNKNKNANVSPNLSRQVLNSRLDNLRKTAGKINPVAGKIAKVGTEVVKRMPTPKAENQETKSVSSIEKKVGGAAITAATGGAVHGEAANQIAGFALKYKKIILITTLLPIIFIIIMAAAVVAIFSNTSESNKAVVSYVSNGNSDELIEQLIYYGYCTDADDCKTKGAYKMAIRLRDLKNNYSQSCNGDAKMGEPCGIPLNTSLIIETINYYQRYMEDYSSDDNYDKDAEENKNPIQKFLEGIANLFVSKETTQEQLMYWSADVLADAQAEYVEAKCNGEIRHYYQISLDKYVSYLMYGESSSHPNYKDKAPKVVESCSGPVNDVISTSYTNSQTNTAAVSFNKNSEGKIESIQGTGKGVDIVNEALKYVGHPYVYGGSKLCDNWNTESGCAIDCSGFTMTILGRYGIKLPHRAVLQYEQAASLGGKVIGKEIGSALPGDLIVFDGHVAIYIGNNYIVHASSPEVGIITSILSDKDLKKMLGIVRYWE